MGIEKYFDAIIVSAEVGAAKPGRLIFEFAFSLILGALPKQSALMIGDSLTSDIKGGANYGIATCWYNPHGKTASASDSVSHEISSLDEVLALI